MSELTASATEASTADAGDNEFQDVVWAGCVPVQLAVFEADLGCILPPDPVVLLVSRMGYLPNIARPFVEAFQSFAVEFSSEAWFEAGGIPLKSHIPFGVLYDMYGRAQRPAHQPWLITVHFLSPTTTTAAVDTLELTGFKLCEKLYFHSLKQSLQLLHGTVRMYNELSVEKQLLLWSAPTKRTRSLWQQFRSVREHLIPTLSDIKQIPLRIIDQRAYETTGQVQIVRQRSVKIIQIDDNNSANNTTDNTSIKTFSLQHVLVDMLHCVSVEELETTTNVVCHGVVLQNLEQMDVYEFWSLCCHADLFLYIILTTKKAT